MSWTGGLCFLVICKKGFDFRAFCVKVVFANPKGLSSFLSWVTTEYNNHSIGGLRLGTGEYVEIQVLLGFAWPSVCWVIRQYNLEQIL